MKIKTDYNYDIPDIPEDTLKDMGFIWDEKENKWILNIGNPIEWYEIKLNKNPKWYEFREQLCQAIFRRG